MKTNMKLLFIAMMLSSANALAGGYELSCSHRHVSEKELMAQAPSGAKRVRKHVLEVKYSGGVKQFSDKPPYDEELSGVQFNYCGYNKELRIHLIGEQNEGFFTGTLLFEDTGKTLSAGQTALFSPDKKKFLAMEQADGKSLQDWTVSDIRGKKLWAGDSGLLQRKKGDDYDTISAEFGNPQWDANSNLTAQMVCSGAEKEGKAALKQTGKTWQWALDFGC